MKFKKIAALLLVLVLSFQLLPVTAMAGTAYPAYFETVKKNVPLRKNIGAEVGILNNITAKGTSVKYVKEEKNWVSPFKYNMWYRVNVDGDTTQTGEGGEYWIYEGNLTAHKHNMDGVYCTTNGCSYNEKPVMEKIDEKERYLIITKNDAPVRKEAYDGGTVVKYLKIDDTLRTVGKYESSRGTVWYKTDDGYWIYSGNIRVPTSGELKAIINSIIGYVKAVAAGIIQNVEDEPENISGGTSGGGSNGGAVSKPARDDLIKLEDLFTYTPCINHNWSVGVCVNCGDVFPMTVVPYSGTFLTTAYNVWAYQEPYTNAAQTKKYAEKGSVVTVNATAKNALNESWYRTTEGDWIYNVKNVSLTKIALSKSSHTFTALGETTVLKCTPTPSNAVYSVQWSSDNPAVATVDAEGVITAKTTGAASITCVATDNSGKAFTKTAKILVPDVADMRKWTYSNTRVEEELLEDCATYMALSYDEYNYIKDGGKRAVYLDCDRHKTPKHLTQLLQEEGKRSRPYNYDDKTRYNSPFVLAEESVNYNGKATPVLYVIIAGSYAKPGWEGNMMLTGSSYNGSHTNYEDEHYTFSLSALNIEKNLQEYIDERGFKEDPIIVITGHSRGGAVGNLLAEHLNNNTEMVQRVYAYLFAVPNCTKDPSNSKNIFNICNDDDLVCYIPLSSGWEYRKNGKTLTFNAGDLYTDKSSSFKSYMDLTFKYSGKMSGLLIDRNEPDYTWEVRSPYSMCEYLEGKWGSVRQYYNHIDRYLSCNDVEAYDYFLTGLAQAACGNTDVVKEHLHLTSTNGKWFCPYFPISLFLAGSGAGTPGLASFNDSHQAYTYYAAVMSGDYNTSDRAHLLEDAEENSIEYGNGTVPLNEAEEEALLDFMYDPEGINELAAMEADWDLEDPDTWEGVRWNTEGRIVELDLSYMGLSGWLNLEEMTELISLNIDGNDITKLIIPDCTKLKDISCFYNDLTSLDVSGCTELQELDCALNQIESIKLENASLSNLNCTGNLLTELDLSASPNLEELRCGSNNLSTLDLSELSALNTVFCGGNQIIESKNENLLSALSAIENAGGSADLGTQQYNDDYAFNEDELTNLTEFAESSLNLEKLGWDLDDPWSWSGVEWKIYGTEYHISSMNLSGLGLEGTLNLPNADYLESIACDDSALSAINLAGCSNLSSVSCRDAGLLDLDVTECENLTSLNCVGNILPVEDTNDSLSQLPGMELQTGVVSYENQLILDDESAFHEEECATLLNLLNIGSNGDLLNWDTELPGTWEGVTWTPAEEGDIYRVAGLDLSSRELEGELDLRGFEYLTDFDFSCTEIETVRLPENIVIMPEYAFYDSGIREIYLPEGIRILNPYTFAYCEELETVVLPKSLARIGEYAFYGCSKLENAVFLGDAPLTGGGSDFNRFETIFRDTNSAFSITYFSDTAWGEDHPLLTTYHTNTAAENTILFLDPDVTLYSDDTFTALNQYCGHDITVVAATRANNLSGTCWLTVYDEQGRMINALHKEITAEDSMFLCTFDDVEIQYVGTGGCRIQALITDSSGTFTPVSVNMDQTLTKPTAAVAD